MFGYLRLFSLLSLLTIIAIAAVAGMSVRNLAVINLTHLIERNNASLAQGYINSVWKNHRDAIVPLSLGDPAQLRTSPDAQKLAEETARYFQRMPLVRANIYNANGALLMTVTIDNSLKIDSGATPSPNSAAIAKHINQANLASVMLQDVTADQGVPITLVQTLVPIRIDGTTLPAGKANEGMLEILYDMSSSFNEVSRFQIVGTFGAVIIFLIFLCILFLTSKKAEMIIAKQHEANIELAAAAAAAQAENQEKSQFLANVSHELRTPLNAIIGFSEIIKNEAPPGKYGDYVNDIHTSGVHLLSLINDILDYSKAEAGKLELEVSEVNTTKMIQNCMRLVNPRAESGQVTLVERLPKEQFIMITDGKKYKQILLNLLSNAVKFTPPGGEVSVTCWQNVADDSLSFEVQDTGIGIAPKDISRAMAPFGQVDNTLKRKYEGTGLGLPLTKKFVELMGGKFTIESEVNVGTKITFTLPREIKEREGIIIKHVA